MAWNFANWYVPLLEGCCHGVNVPVPYEDGMTFLESNERIITIINQLIDNNNEIPEIIKEEVKTELRAYLDSDEGKQQIIEIIEAADMPFINDTGDTVTGNYIFQNVTTGKQTQITPGNIGIAQGNPTVLESLNITDNGLRILNTGSDDKQIDVTQHRITSLMNPRENNDAATKLYVDNKVAALGNVLDFKGVKATQAELPTTGNTVGDVWYVEETKSAWAWVKDTTNPNGRWDEFGPVIDLSPYFKKADIEQSTGNSTTKVMSQNATTDAIHAAEYSLPVASSGTLGGVIAPVKTSAETEQVHVDAQGKMWVKPSSVTVNPSTTTPKMDGTATVGTETKYARGDHIHPKDTSKVDVEIGKGLSTNDYTNADKTKLAGIAPNANNYTLPIANEGAIGGVKAPAKGANDNRQITVDSDGNLWTEDIVPYELPVANYTRLGGIKASVDACPIIEQRQGVCVEPDGKAWVPKLMPATDNLLGGIKASSAEIVPEKRLGVYVDTDGKAWVNKMQPATANTLGGIKADESSEAMPVEIAIDPATHKLKGALMTAYNSPTQIGGVVKNGEKTAAETQPVVMDSDGKQWVKQGIITGDASIDNNITTFLGANVSWKIKSKITNKEILTIRAKKVSSDNVYVGYHKDSYDASPDIYEIVNTKYAINHLSGIPLDSPTAAGQIPKYNGTKVIWEAPAISTQEMPQNMLLGSKEISANEREINIPDVSGRTHCIATLMNANGNWIKNTTKNTDGFVIELNAAATANMTLCYILFD